jgi:nitrous oxidase accessory protein
MSKKDQPCTSKLFLQFLTRLFVTSIISLLIIASSIYSKDIVVTPQGNIQQVSRALELAKKNDRILIKKGIYRESNLLVNKSIEIIGEDFPEIDGENKGQVFLIQADSVILKGLVIKNAAVSFLDDNAGVQLDSSFHCILENNKFINNFFAIYLSRSANCKIIGNIVQGEAQSQSTSGNGIHLWYCKDIDIENNQVRGHRDGIYFEFVEEGKISGNISEHNLRYGLHFMFSDRCHYENNVFRNNGSGVAVMYTKYVEMYNNKFEYNWGDASYGLLLKDITDSKISNNTFLRNTIGIYAENSNRIDVRHNRFIENGWAVKIMANCLNNLFTGNNFMGNTFDVSTNSRQNFNTFDKNYWANYKGYDLNKDGYGDVPYHPVSFFSYIVEKNPPTLILLRGLFVQVLDLAESVIPMLTPATLIDENPLIRSVQ